MKTISLKNGSSSVIKLSERMDAADLGRLDEAAGGLGGSGEILIDLTDVSYLPEGFLQWLWKVKTERPGMAGRIRLVNPNEVAQKMIEASPVNNVFEIRHIFPTAW
jgi:anti-anti-sigma regulatory factor